MKNKLKIGMLVLITGTFTLSAADNLEEVFSNGKFKGVFQSYYFSKDYDSKLTSDANIFVNGGKLGYETDSLNGIKAGVTFQISHVTSIDDKSNKYKTQMNASGSVLSQAYIEYENRDVNSSLKVGRQFIWSPLVASSGTRLVKQSFEAYVLKNKSFQNTKIMLAYLDKLQSRTDNNEGIASFEKISTDGAYTVYIENKSINNLRLRAQYLNVKDDYETLFASGLYNFDGFFNPSLGFTYFATKYDDSSEKSSYSTGINASINISKIKLFGAVAKTDENNAVNRGLGYAVKGHFPTVILSVSQAAYEADAKSYQIGASYKKGNFLSRLTYSSFDLPKNSFGIFNSDLEETTLTFMYKFDKKLKGMSASVDYAIVNSGANNQEKNVLWTKLQYTF